MVNTARIVFLLLISIFFGEVSSASISDETIEAAYYESYTLERSQNYLRAIEVLYPVLSAFENGYTINFRVGWLYYLDGKHADALRYLKKALAVYPASIEVMNCISLVYKARNDWAKVEEQNYQIIKMDPLNATANYWYVVALRMHKKYDLAEKACRKMLTVYPTSVWFLQELGEDLYYKKQFRDSREVFTSVKTLDPSNDTAKKYLKLLSAGKQEKN